MHASSLSSDSRPVDRWFAAYAADHQHPRNQQLHVLCVPAIVWSLLAMLHAIPTPAMFAGSLPAYGVVASVLIALSLLFWLRLSWSLGIGSALLVALSLWSNLLILEAAGPAALLAIGAIVFVIAWVGQFIGHHIEGRRPSFFTDLVYLMIGPPWVLAKAYHRLGLRW